VSFGKRSVSKRGAIISGDVEQVRSLLERGLKSPNGEMFVHDGEVLCALLAEAVHAGVDPGPELETETRGFMAFGRQFSTSALGRAIRRSGMSDNDTTVAMRSGEWDPFAAVEIPQ